MPSQSSKDLWESEALGSSPSCLPSWSPARRPPSSHPNMKHCLEIHVTLTEELGAVPPPFHSWTVLFYWRCSMGEGLAKDETRDAAFLLTRTGTWVGKPAYLAADPMTIQEGQWAIVQAITDYWVKVRGARTSTCKSASPTNLQVWPSERFPHKGYLQGWWLQLSTITTSAPKGLRLQ